MDYDKILDKGDDLNIDGFIDTLFDKLIELSISQNYMNSFINRIGVDNLVDAFVNNSDLWNEVKSRMMC